MDLATIGLLCVVAVSSFSIHHYYARKLGFRKIKKYLDNRENTFKSSFQKKLQNLEDASIHFDVDLKKYQQFSKIVSTELSQLEKKIFLFEEIDKRLNERIREYNDQKEAMDAMAKDINKQAEQFKQNRNFLKDLDSSIKTAEKKVSDFMDNAKKVIEDHAQNLENALVEKSGVLIDKMDGFLENEAKNTSIYIKEQKEKFEDQANDFIQQSQFLQTKMDELTHQVDDKIQEVLTGHIAQEVHNQIRNKARETFNEMDRWREIIQTHIEPSKDLIQNLPNQIIQTKNELESNKNNLIEEIKRQKIEVIEAWEKERVDRLDELKSEVGSTQETLMANMEAHLSASEKARSEEVSNLRKQIDQLREDAKGRLHELIHDQIEPQFGHLADVKTEIQENGAQLHSLRDQLEQLTLDQNQQREKLESSFIQWTERLNAQMENESKGITQKLSETLEGKNNDLEKLLTDFKDQIESQEKLIQEQVQTKQKEVQKELEAWLSSTKDNQKTHYANLSGKMETNSKEEFDAFKRFLSKKQDQVQKELRYLKELSQLKTQHERSIEQFETRIKQDEAWMSEAKQGFSDKSLKAYEDLVKFKETQKKAMLQTEEKFLKEVADHLRQVENIEIKNTKRDLQQIIKDSTKKLEKHHDAFLKKQNNEEQKIRQIQTHAEKKLESLLDNMRNELGEIEERSKDLGKIEHRVNSEIQALEKRIDTNVDQGLQHFYQESEGKLDNLYEKLSEDFENKTTQYHKEAEKTLSETMAEMLKNLESKKESFIDQASFFKDTLKEKEKNIDRELSAFLQLSTEAKGEITDQQNTIFEYIQDAKKYVEEIKPLVEARDEYMKSIKQKLKEAIQVLQQEQSSTLQEIQLHQSSASKELQGKIHESERNLSQLQRNVEDAIDNKDKQFIQYQDELRKTRKDAEEKFGQFLSDLQGEFQRFREVEKSNRDDILQQHQTDYDQHLSNWKKQFSSEKDDFIDHQTENAKQYIEKLDAQLSIVQNKNQEVLEQLTEHEAVLQNADERTQDLLKNYKKEFEGFTQTVSRFDENVDKLLFSNRRKDFDAFFENYLSNSKGMLAKFIDEKQNAIDDELSSLTDLLHQQRENIIEMSELSRADISQNTEKVKQEAINRLNELEELSKIEYKSIQDQFHQSTGELKEKVHKTEEQASNLMKEIAFQAKKQEQLSMQYRETMDKQQQENVRQTEAYMDEAKNSFQKFIDQSGNRVNKAIEDFEQTALNFSEQEGMRVKEIIKDFSREINEAKEKSEETLSSHIEELRTEIVSSDTHFADLRENLTKDMRDGISLFKNEIEREMGHVKEEVNQLSVKRDKRYLQFEETVEKEMLRVKKQSESVETIWKKHWEQLQKKDLNKIDQVLDKFKEKLAKTEDTLKTKLTGLDELQGQSESQIVSIKKNYENAFKESRKRLDELHESGEVVHRDLMKEFEEQRKSLKNEFNALKQETRTQQSQEVHQQKERVQSLVKGMESSQKQFDLSIQESGKELSQLKEKLNEYEQLQKTALEHAMVENEKKLENFIHTKEASLESSTQKMMERFKKKENSLSKGADENFTKLNEQFKVVMEKVDSFVAQTGVFKKVDLLREKLNGDLNEYAEKIQRIKNDYKSFASIDQKLSEIKKVETEAKKVLKTIRDEKAELKNTESKLDQLQKLTENLDKKIKVIDGTSKEIDSFHNSLSNYTNETKQLKSNVESLTAHQKDIEQSLELISKLEEKSAKIKKSYGSLDNRIDTASEQQMHLDKRLAQIEEKSILIEANHKKIIEFSKKYDALEIAVSDVEQRQRAMEKIRNELAVEKKNLTEIMEELQNQIKLAVKVRNTKNTSPNENDNMELNHDEVKDMVQTLARMGWPREQIAQHLKKELYEVDVYLNK